jgi:hypothetical protein
MMFPFGKLVAEPTSDAIHARRAMAHHGSSIVVLSTRLVRATFLHLCPSQSHPGWRFSPRDISACEGRFS